MISYKYIQAKYKLDLTKKISMLLAIQWGVVGVKTLQLILSLSILVVLHELGHFIPAKLFKCRVEKFYLFFDPWFSIVKKKIGETVYGLGWVPFGGYVKISGMIDESMDKEQMKLPPQPYEFRSKPAWQRLIIMIGGVTVNVLLAIIIFAGIMYTWGEEYLPPQNLKYGMYADSLGKKIGLQDGDIITKVGNDSVRNINKVAAQIALSEPKNITVDRNGNTILLNIDDDLIKALHHSKTEGFADIRVPYIIDSILSNSDALKKGIKKGDRVIGVGSVQTLYAHDFFNEMKKDTSKKNVQLKLLRDNKDTLTVDVALNENKKIGIYPMTEFKKLGFTTEIKKYSLLESIPAGMNKSWDVLSKNLIGFKQIFTGKAKASESLGSVISIGNLFPSEWDWQSFWTLTGILSIILAFMNILPIPALDGGHALFTIIEMLTGRKPSDKFMEYAQMFGMILLLGLMAYALGLDFMRLFK